ncbi:MAG TPA: sigma-70 family RNA polymerase sigma factor [Prolixibacteraceae bacterium]|nr:sigma-70 family RNA polymerase sigma factor [Prolixibacteraceae bacterium]
MTNGRLEELEKLIEDCKAGKRDAQARLYQQYAPVLFGVCLRYAQNQAEAEDILHDGFLAIFSKIGQYAFKGSFEGWMKRIMVNLALEKYRTRFRLQTVDDLSPYDRRSEKESISSSLNEAFLMDLISELPPRYKMVFNLYAIDGYSHKEIAEMLDIVEGTSKSNLARARKLLQDRMVELGFIEKAYAE